MDEGGVVDNSTPKLSEEGDDWSSENARLGDGFDKTDYKNEMKTACRDYNNVKRTSGKIRVEVNTKGRKQRWCTKVKTAVRVQSQTASIMDTPHVYIQL